MKKSELNLYVFIWWNASNLLSKKQVMSVICLQFIKPASTHRIGKRVAGTPGEIQRDAFNAGTTGTAVEAGVSTVLHLPLHFQAP